MQVNDPHRKSRRVYTKSRMFDVSSAGNCMIQRTGQNECSFGPTKVRSLMASLPLRLFKVNLACASELNASRSQISAAGRCGKVCPKLMFV
jgi:hypothetical protein